jgi:hypothetical protein
VSAVPDRRFRFAVDLGADALVIHRICEQRVFGTMPGWSPVRRRSPPRSELCGPVDGQSRRASLGIREPQASLQGRLQDPILGNQIFIPQQQLLVHGPGDICQDACPLHKLLTSKATKNLPFLLRFQIFWPYGVSLPTSASSRIFDLIGKASRVGARRSTAKGAKVTGRRAPADHAGNRPCTGPTPADGYNSSQGRLGRNSHNKVRDRSKAAARQPRSR